MSAIGAGAGSNEVVVQPTVNTNADIKELFDQNGPICNSEGFYQHYGECWSDTFQMLMLYTDGIKEFTQAKLALEEVNETEIQENEQINTMIDENISPIIKDAEKVLSLVSSPTIIQSLLPQKDAKISERLKLARQLYGQHITEDMLDSLNIQDLQDTPTTRLLLPPGPPLRRVANIIANKTISNSTKLLDTQTTQPTRLLPPPPPPHANMVSESNRRDTEMLIINKQAKILQEIWNSKKTQPTRLLPPPPGPPLRSNMNKIANKTISNSTRLLDTNTTKAENTQITRLLPLNPSKPPLPPGYTKDMWNSMSERNKAIASRPSDWASVNNIPERTKEISSLPPPPPPPPLSLPSSSANLMSLLNTPLGQKLKQYNLRAVYLYFKAVQARFSRHYREELLKYKEAGDIQCYEFDKIGKDALEVLRKISVESRSQTKGLGTSGIQSAIMSKASKNFIEKNREKITVEQYAPDGFTKGGTIDVDFTYLLKLYNSYFNLNLQSKLYRILEFISSKVDKNNLAPCYYVHIKRTLESMGHITGFYMCGNKEYYYDDESGTILFPWKRLLKKYLELDNVNFYNIEFVGKLIVEQKGNYNKILEFKYYPVICYKDSYQKFYITYINSIDEEIKITFKKNDKNPTNVIELKNKNIHYILQFEKNEYENMNNFILQNIIAIWNDTKINASSALTIGMNVKTGKYQGSRLPYSKSYVQTGKLNEKKEDFLQYAISIQSKDRIREALENKSADITKTDNKNNTVLHVAINLNDIDFLNYLLQKPNIDKIIDLANSYGETPLLTAIPQNLDMVKMLLENGANHYVPNDKNGAYPLNVAIIQSNTLINKEGPEYRKSLEIIDICSKDLLSTYTKKEIAKFVSEVIRPNYETLTNIEAFKILIKNGYDVNDTSYLSFQPLQIVLYKESIEYLKVLVENNFNFKKYEQDTGFSILNQFIRVWKDDSVKTAIDLLVQAGEDIQQKLKQGGNLLFLAAIDNNLFALKYLVEKYKLDINQKDNFGYTILYMITNKKEEYLETFANSRHSTTSVLKMMELLIQLGADVNIQDNDGNTPLFLAVFKLNPDKVKLLCENGADSSIKNNAGNTAYNWLERISTGVSSSKLMLIEKIKEAFKQCKKKKAKAVSGNATGAGAGSGPGSGKGTGQGSGKGAGQGSGKGTGKGFTRGGYSTRKKYKRKSTRKKTQRK